MKKLLATFSLFTVLLVGTGCEEEASSPPPEPTPAGESADTAASAPAPSDTQRTSAGVPSSAVETEGALDSWTAGVVAHPAPGTGASTLTTVRAGQHHEFDRAVFEFESDSLPAYHIEYVDKPIRKCGSGETVEVAGDGWLEVRMTSAQAHTEGGEPTVTERSRLFDMPVLKQMTLTCDFEGTVTWVLGAASPNEYRVLEVPDPARLVIDIQH